MVAIRTAVAAAGVLVATEALVAAEVLVATEALVAVEVLLAVMVLPRQSEYFPRFRRVFPWYLLTAFCV